MERKGYSVELLRPFQLLPEILDVHVLGGADNRERAINGEDLAVGIALVHGKFEIEIDLVRILILNRLSEELR